MLRKESESIHNSTIDKYISRNPGWLWPNEWIERSKQTFEEEKIKIKFLRKIPSSHHPNRPNNINNNDQCLFNGTKVLALVPFSFVWILFDVFVDIHWQSRPSAHSMRHCISDFSIKIPYFKLCVLSIKQITFWFFFTHTSSTIPFVRFPYSRSMFTLLLTSLFETIFRSMVRWFRVYPSAIISCFVYSCILGILLMGKHCHEFGSCWSCPFYQKHFHSLKLVQSNLYTHF